jgi:hypothetical protein
VVHRDAPPKVTRRRGPHAVLRAGLCWQQRLNPCLLDAYWECWRERVGDYLFPFFFFGLPGRQEVAPRETLGVWRELYCTTNSRACLLDRVKKKTRAPEPTADPSTSRGLCQGAS